VDEVDEDELARSTDLTKQMALNRYLFHRSRLGKLQQVYTILYEHTASFFSMLMYYQEFQRLLLDIRGWIYWASEVRNRLLNPDFNQPFPILPVRGVITSDSILLQKFFRMGIPVWYIRKGYTFTQDTWINRILTLVEAHGFSNRRTVDGESGPTAAPAWRNGIHMGLLSPNEVQVKARKFSILNTPQLQEVKAYELQEERRTESAPGMS
jgi:hypothetical protein